MSDFQERLGKCYELTVHEMWNLGFKGEPDNLRLVHGTIGSNKNPHAWLTWTSDEIYNSRLFHMEWAWEPINQNLLPYDAFGRLYVVAVNAEYTSQEASDMLARYEHYGPWHQEQGDEE